MEDNIINPPYIDKELPDIKLEAYQGGKEKKISLSQYKGKWVVLLFYPADFTFICPTELEDAAKQYSKFQKLGAEILSVSTDTVFVHKAWHDNSEAIGKIKYPMIADPAGKLCRALGTYIADEGLSYRATVIVDPKGKIKSYEIHDNSIGRNVDEIYRKLQASKYVSEHKGIVCPVNWKPGSKTLKPSMKLVGKI